MVGFGGDGLRGSAVPCLQLGLRFAHTTAALLAEATLLWHRVLINGGLLLDRGEVRLTIVVEASQVDRTIKRL